MIGMIWDVWNVWAFGPDRYAKRRDVESCSGIQVRTYAFNVAHVWL